LAQVVSSKAWGAPDWVKATKAGVVALAAAVGHGCGGHCSCSGVSSEGSGIRECSEQEACHNHNPLVGKEEST
jgi:hypothetical protein